MALRSDGGLAAGSGPQGARLDWLGGAEPVGRDLPLVVTAIITHCGLGLLCLLLALRSPHPLRPSHPHPRRPPQAEAGVYSLVPASTLPLMGSPEASTWQSSSVPWGSALVTAELPCSAWSQAPRLRDVRERRAAGSAPGVSGPHAGEEQRRLGLCDPVQNAVLESREDVHFVGEVTGTMATGTGRGWGAKEGAATWRVAGPVRRAREGRELEEWW